MRVDRWLMGLVWLTSAGLIALNFWLYPVGNGRDEIYHLQLIDFYTREWRFTELPQDWDESSPQAHQPPLYHLSMAALLETGLPELGRLNNFILNPYMVYPSDRYDPDTPAYNRVAYVHHHPGDSAPYMTTIRVLQGISILMNLTGVFFVWRAVRLLFLPDSNSEARYILPLTLAFLLMTPTFWRRAMGVNNDQFIFLFAAVVTWLLARILKNGVRWQESVLLVLCLGAGLLTKIYMFPLVTTTAIVFLWLPHRKKALLHLLAIGLITLIISGWWYIRNYQRYGDFTASSISEDFLNTQRADSMALQEFVEVLLTWPGESWLEYDVIIPITRPALWLASGIGIFLVVCSVLALRKYGIPGSGILLFGALIPALAMAVIGQAENMHGNYSPPIMMTALPAMNMLFALGVMAIVDGGLKVTGAIYRVPTGDISVGTPYMASVTISYPHLTSRIAVTAVLLIFTGTVIYHANAFEPLYPPLRIVNDPAELDVQNRVAIDFENGALLVGYEFEKQAVEPGEEVRVKLCWQATENLNRQPLYVVTTALVLPDTPNAAVIHGFPLSGRYPVSQWKTGTAYCEWIPLRVEENAVTPRVYGLSVGMSENLQPGTEVFYTTPDGQRAIYLSLGQIAVVDPIEGDVPPLKAQVDSWGGLIDYEARLENRTLTLTMDWLTLESAPGNYHYFLHALDAEGNLLTGLDLPPLNGQYPTERWQKNVRYRETLALENVPPEAVTFRFGVYQPKTGQRGQWMAGGQSVGDGLVLAVG